MDEDFPHVVVLVVGALQSAGDFPVADPVSGAAARAVAAPTQLAIGAPTGQFIDDAVLAAASSGVPDRSNLPDATLSFDLDGENIGVTIAPEYVEDAMLSLYVSSGWDGVQALLFALGREVFPITAAGRPQGLSPASAVQARVVEQRQAFATAVSAGLVTLRGLIEDTLVEFAEAGLLKAEGLATAAREQLDRAEKTYGVRLKPQPLPSTTGAGGSGGTSGAGGGGNTGGNSGAEGGSGHDTPPEYEIHDPAVPGAAEDLANGVRALAKAYAKVEDAQGKIDAYKNSPAGAAPANAGTGGSGGSTPPSNPPGTPTPYPARPDPGELPEATKAFHDLMRQVGEQHPVAPGVLAMCLPERESGTDLKDQVVLAQLFAYLPAARGYLTQIPKKYPTAMFRYELGRSVNSINRELKLNLSDTPETRAALWAGRDGRGGILEPLLADQLLGAVRADLVAASTAADEETLLRTAFALSVLNSYLAAGDARDLVRYAALDKAEAPLRRYDKTVAFLSIVGYFVKPVAAVSAVLGVMTVYGHMFNQFAVLAAENAELDNVALEALLLDDTGRYVTTLANKPRAGKIVEEILLSTGKSMALSTCVPALGLFFQVVSDVQTLAE